MKNREVVLSPVVDLPLGSYRSDTSVSRGDGSAPGEKWAMDQTAGTSSMNQVFCDHPSVIYGREFRCPDCHLKVGPIPPALVRPFHPLLQESRGGWCAS